MKTKTCKLLAVGVMLLFTLFPVSSSNKDIYSHGGAGPSPSDSVSPLLTTTWGMRGSYAKFVPIKNIEEKRLGCWTIAFAQILYYHRMKPHGIQGYRCHDKKNKIYENFNSHQFDFSLFVDELEDTTPYASVYEVAKYLYFCAVVIQKDFFPPHHFKYMINSNKRADEVQDHYYVSTKHYSNKTFFPRKSMVLRTFIISELNKGRPMLLFLKGTDGSGNKGEKKQKPEHAMVIDGYKIEGGKFKVHINMGWYGKENDYYDFHSKIHQYNDTKNYILITIKPKIQMKGYELLFDNKTVGSEPNWSFHQAIINLLQNRKRHPDKKVVGRYNREIIVISGTGYELFRDNKRVSHEPNWTYNKAKKKFLWNIKKYSKKKIIGMYNGKTIPIITGKEIKKNRIRKK